LRLFESATDGILILNAETGKIIDVNPFWLKKVILKSNYGKTIWEIGCLKI
jgi:two-component system CheB/CheR fusion protein